MNIRLIMLLVALLAMLCPTNAFSDEDVPYPSNFAAVPSTGTGHVLETELQQALENANAQLKKLSEADPEESYVKEKQQLFERRVDVVGEMLATIEQISRLKTQEDELPEKIEEIQEKTAEIDALPPVQPPSEPQAADLEDLEERLNKTRSERDDLLRKNREQRRLIENTNELIQASRYAASSAGTDIRALRKELASATSSEDEKEILQIQIENAILNEQKAALEQSLLETREAVFTETKPYVDALASYFDKTIARQQKEFDLYHEAIEAFLKQEKALKEKELTEKRRAAQTAVTPIDRFIYQKEEMLAASESHIAQLKLRLAELSDIEQKGAKRLSMTKRHIETVLNVLDNAKSSTYAGRRLREFFEDAQEIRRSIQTLSMDRISKQIETDRDRYFELEQLQVNLQDTWRMEAESASAGQPQPVVSAFMDRSEELLKQYQETISSEITLLASVIQAKRKIDALFFELINLIDTTEQTLLSRLFWIRDNKPLGVATLVDVKKDVVRLQDWWGASLKEWSERTVRSRLVRMILLGVLFLLVVPLTLVRIRKIFDKRFTESDFKSMTSRIFIFILLRTFMTPAYLLVVGLAVKLVPMPGSFNLLISNTCHWLALALLVWLLARAVFNDRRLAKYLFEMRENTAKAFRGCANRLILFSLVFAFPSYVLSQDPLHLSNIHRVGMTVFSIFALFPIFNFIKNKSPFARHMQAYDGYAFVNNNWGGWVFMVMTALVTGIIMHVSGYTYGGYRIYRNTLLTLLFLTGMFGFHRILLAMLKKQPHRPRVREGMGEMTEEEMAALAQKIRRQKQQIVKVLSITLTIIIAAAIWGVNEQVIKSLDHITVYTITTAAGLEPVNLADICLALLTLLIMGFVLKYLPGLYDSFLFPRFNMDTGMRYALLTISRYGIFTLCVLIALSFIHLDLGRIGWLMAAVGFGLGFGMQEIFSNFISGLILLVERPVRIGDIVKVGGVLGTVSRINIRATTVTDFDRLEIIIPNKDFITQQVTNWTLGNKMIRVIVPIGVAYGSDPNEIVELLLGIVKEDDNILKDPGPSALFLEHGDSSLNFELRCFIEDADLLLTTKSYLNTRINEELNKRGIEIPFPQRDIHIRSDATKSRNEENSASGNGG